MIMGLIRHLDKDQRNCNSQNEDKVERSSNYISSITLKDTVANYFDCTKCKKSPGAFLLGKP